MKEVNPPSHEGSYKLLIERARKKPNQWFDVTDDFATGPSTAHANFYRTAGRFFTPVQVVTRGQRVLICWKEVTDDDEN